MAAFAGQGQALSGEQLQPEVHILLDLVEGTSTIDFRSMSHKQAETIRKMRNEFFAHFRPTIGDTNGK